MSGAGGDNGCRVNVLGKERNFTEERVGEDILGDGDRDRTTQGVEENGQGIYWDISIGTDTGGGGRGWVQSLLPVGMSFAFKTTCTAMKGI